MFNKFEIKSNISFNELTSNIIFEDIIPGRQCANLIDYQNNLIPLVRTTTQYKNPPQIFKNIHFNLIEQIKNVSKIDNLKFNNAMIELYDSRYTNMQFHTDQSLDLDPNSYICIFSSYEKPNIVYRKLVIKDKITNNISEYELTNNSIILFSIETNHKYLHKIILEDNKIENKWLGITLRLSKTFIQFINEMPYFYKTNNILKLANNEEKKQFINCKRLENLNIQYEWPEINFTLSESDLLALNNLLCLN